MTRTPTTKVDISDLYFGIKWWEVNKNQFETRNLFDSSRVKESVARWVLMDTADRKDIKDPLHFLYGSLWSRVEWEFGVCSVFCKSMDAVEKTDVYEFYIEPNRDYLLALANSVTKASAQRYLKELKDIRGY